MTSDSTANADLPASPRHRRRWFQFSLRTLLIAVTLVCVTCALFVAPKARRHASIQAIERLGGEIDYSDIPAGDSWLNRTLREYLPKDWFDDVVKVTLLDCTEASDSVLAGLKSFTTLEELYLGGTRVTDGELVYLKGLARLQELHLSGTQITDAGLVHLKGLTRLQIIWLNNLPLTDAGVAELKQALPNCNIQYRPVRKSEHLDEADR